MTAQRNRQWILMRRPVGEIREGDLVLRTDPIPVPAAGEVVVRNEWLSLDPANRVYMSDVKQYMPPVALGDPMRGFICGTVVASGAPAFAVGAVVMGLGTWSEYSCVPAEYLMPVPEVQGLTRKDVFGQGYIVAPTALLGLRHIGAPRPGETMLVSAAAGAVGSLAGQIGKAWGCKVIGLAGDDEKRDWIVRDLGFDQALDYRGADFAQRLRAACPDGIDIFYDNVAGNVLDVVLGQMNLRGRVVQCGLISSYNDDLHGQSFRNYGCIVTQRLKVEGFIVIDWFDEYPAMFREVAELHRSGRLNWRYHDVDGLEHAVDAVKLLFQGRNRGKMIVRV